MGLVPTCCREEVNPIEAQVRALQHQGNLPEAEKLCRNELQRTHESEVWIQSLDTIKLTNTLAVILDRQGKWTEAEALCREVLSVRHTVLGPMHLDTLVAMSNLGGVLQGQGKLEEAETLHTVAL